MVALLERGDLDAGATPSGLNLGEILTGRGLEHAGSLGYESIWLDVDPAIEDSQRDAIEGAIDHRLLDEGLLRTHGNATASLWPGPETEPAPPRSRARPGEGSGTIRLSTSTGDALLGMIQRVLQLQLEGAGFDVELVKAEPRELYGPWRVSDPTDVALLRAAGAPGLSVLGRGLRAGGIPIAHVETMLAWRPGVTGLEPNPTLDGPLWNAESWSVGG